MYTDEEILDLLEQDKDYGAKVLMGQYSSLIRSTCASKLRSQEDIDECVNDVFAEFCLNYSRFDKTKGTLRNLVTGNTKTADGYMSQITGSSLLVRVPKKIMCDSWFCAESAPQYLQRF